VVSSVAQTYVFDGTISTNDQDMHSSEVAMVESCFVDVDTNTIS